MTAKIEQALYKVMSPEEWERSQLQEYLVRGAIDTTFIHLATQEQYPKVLEKFWKGREVVLLTLDPSRLEGRLVFEKNPGGATLYPHLYDAEIPLQAVVSTQTTRSSHS